MVTTASVAIAVALQVSALAYELPDAAVDLRGAQPGAGVGQTLACGPALDHGGATDAVELLIGAPSLDPGGADGAGAVLWIEDLAPWLGEGDGYLDAASLPTALCGDTPDEALGSALAFGDVDGDGASELWIGAPGYRWGEGPAGGGYGRMLLLDGGNSWAAWDESAADHAALEISVGEALGPVVAELGGGAALADVDGDGLDDLWGVAARVPASETAAGEGSPGVGFAALIPAAELDLPGPAEHRDLRSLAYGIAGGSASTGGGLGALHAIGDLDGDGVGEIAVVDGDPAASGGGASIYLFLSDQTLHPSLLWASQASVQIRAVTGLDRLGASLAVGDIDGDGDADLVAGAPGYGGRGAVAVFPGPAGAWPAELTLDDDAHLLEGEGDGADLGEALALVDLDGDGALDVVVGAPGRAAVGSPRPGRVVMVRGGAALTLTPGEGRSLESTVALELLGEAGDEAGAALCLPGDLDGDGRDDLVIGAPGATPAAGLDAAGRVFVVRTGAIPDADGDGHSGLDDCDDADAAVYPGAPDACDGVDNDCDGAVEAGDVDADGDGVSSCAGDCDDGDAAANLADADGDGFDTCGDAERDADCDDEDPEVYPRESEDTTCDGIDNDCDGQVDEDGSRPYYVDLDLDGYGDPEQVQTVCWSKGYAAQPGDCDDTDDTVHPGADDPPNDGVDQDCDGVDFYGGQVCWCRVDGAASGGAGPLSGGTLALVWLLRRRRRRTPRPRLSRR